MEQKLWTWRLLCPALLFYLHPFLALWVLSGEQKGCDVAMAQLQGLGFQMWPWFSVDQPHDTQLSRLRRRLRDGTFPCEATKDKTFLESLWPPW